MVGWKRFSIGMFLTLLMLAVFIPSSSAWSGSASLSPYTVYRGEPTSFTVTVNINDSRSTDVSWVWVHFGWQASGVGYYFKADDGTKVSISGYGSSDFGLYSITVPETALGQYSVEIRVRAQATGDWWAETKTSTDYVNVATIPTLQASATGNPNSGTAPLTVYFSSTVSGGLSPYTYSWSFGDGYTSSQQNPSHIYSSAGTYTARVTVTDGASSANRQIVSDSITINVSERSTFLTISPSSFTVGYGQTQALTAALTSGGSSLAGKTISWSATAGSVSPSSGTTISSGQVSVTYTAPSSAASVTITASFAGDGQYAASSAASSGMVQFSVTFTFTKLDGSSLANTTIYYSTSRGQETNVLGTTDSYSRITSTNLALAGQTIYFKSSDGKYTGSTSISSSGGTVSASLTEVSGFPVLAVVVAVIVIGCIAGGVGLAWRKRR